MIAQLAVSGLVSGAIYALVGMGLVVIYRATQVVNFAQGEMMMLGAFFGLYATESLGLPYALAFVVAVAATAAVGWLVDRVSYRPLHRAPHMTQVLATLAIANVLKGLALLVWGTESYGYPYSERLSAAIVEPVYLNYQQAIVFVSALVIMAGLWAFFRFSGWGKAMRALSQNPTGAAICGVNVGGVFALSWAMSAGLGAAAGVLYAPLTLIDTAFGWVLIKGFAVAILGGFGSLPGAALGGLILGLVESLWSLAFPVLWAPVLAYVFIIAVLLIKPSGLLGSKAQRKL